MKRLRTCRTHPGRKTEKTERRRKNPTERWRKRCLKLKVLYIKKSMMKDVVVIAFWVLFSHLQTVVIAFLGLIQSFADTNFSLH